MQGMQQTMPGYNPMQLQQAMQHMQAQLDPSMIDLSQLTEGDLAKLNIPVCVLSILVYEQNSTCFRLYL